MRACILFWAIFLIPGFVRGGSISGVVRADAAKEMSSAGGGGGGAYDGHKMKFVERVDYAQLHDFIVFIDQPFTNTVPPDPKPVRVITQKDAIFKPLVLPVMAGTTVEWPNEDKIYHNVFSMS